MDPLAQIGEAVCQELLGYMDLAAGRGGMEEAPKAVVHRLEEPLGVVEGVGAADGLDEIDRGHTGSGTGTRSGAPPTRRAGEG